jgi:hypothetical protein
MAGHGLPAERRVQPSHWPANRTILMDGGRDVLYSQAVLQSIDPLHDQVTGPLRDDGGPNAMPSLLSKSTFESP